MITFATLSTLSPEIQSLLAMMMFSGLISWIALAVYVIRGTLHERKQNRLRLARIQARGLIHHYR